MSVDRGSSQLGVFPAKRDDRPVLPDAIDVEDPRSSFFADGRDGIDRWGRARAGLTACGTGWDEYVCPLYVEESCPGARNKGDRTQPDITNVCDLDCGGCGGGGRTHTMGYCGQQRGAANMRAAMAEMGGSLRLDKWMAPPATAIDGWPAPYFPVVEHYCVPMDTELLTRDGWKLHHEVRVGDETLGLNPTTGENEWTTITEVQAFDDVEVIELASTRYALRCTANHRLLVDDMRARYRDRAVACRRADELRHVDRVIVAAPSAGGDGPLTAQEAAIIAWVLCDGSITRGAPTSRKYGRRPGTDEKHARARALRSEGLTQQQIADRLQVRQGTVSTWLRGGKALRDPATRDAAFTAVIGQSKPRGLHALDHLLDGVPHSKRRCHDRADEFYIYRLSSAYARELWRRAGLLDAEISPRWVLGLSREARAAFMEACWLAEGHETGGVRLLTQNRGPFADAMALGAYLEGYRPGVSAKGARCLNISLACPRVGAKTLVTTSKGRERVWCVTTELGSMTIRQGEQISLTGNSKNWKHILQTLPMIGTTMQSVYSGRRKKNPTLLRDRLGGYEGKLCVTGLVKDDLLDDVWDDLEHVLRYLRHSDADVVVAPQFCVPLDTELLTRDGFKSHSQVRVGDETLGFNPATGRSEWTKVTRVHHYQLADTVMIGNSRWRATCTPEHRWLIERSRGDTSVQLRETRDLAYEDRLRLSWPAEGGESALTPTEAAVVAWALCDGNIRLGPATTKVPRPKAGRLREAIRVYHAEHGGSQAEVAEHFGCAQATVSRALAPERRKPVRERAAHERSVQVTITQSKVVGIDALRELLAGVPHTERDRGDGCLTFTLHVGYARPLWIKAGLMGDEPNLCELVASLSTAARRAFLDAAWLAEGHTAGGDLRIISQKRGAVADAIALAAYLEGYRPSVRQANADPDMRAITLARPWVGARTLTFEEMPRQDVWCVTTELGSMTIRQGDQISLSGQSYYDENANGMAVFNANRIFAYYTRCMELGFPTVALDVPPFAAEWLHYEFIDFVVRSQVKVIACSYQTFGTRGALDPRHVIGARRMHRELPDDVAVMVFGVGQRVGQAQLAKLLPGRKLVFADKAPYAFAIFFTLLPHQTNAPPGMKKDAVFEHNVREMTRQVQLATRPPRRVARRGGRR